MSLLGAALKMQCDSHVHFPHHNDQQCSDQPQFSGEDDVGHLPPLLGMDMQYKQEIHLFKPLRFQGLVLLSAYPIIT